jgi:hypothetical protein
MNQSRWSRRIWERHLVDLVEHVADRIRIKAVEIARTHQFTFERDLSVERVCRHAYRERTLCLSMHLDPAPGIPLAWGDAA